MTIAGRVYEENGKVYILFRPKPDIHHIILLILCAIAIVVFLIMLEWRGIIGVILISGIVSLFEFSRLRDQYDDLKEFIKEICQQE